MEKNFREELIDFEGGQILGVKTENGKIYLGIKKACEDIGLNDNQARNEVKKVQNNLLFQRHNSIIKLSVKFDTQVRETILIEESDINIWLAQISLTPKMQEENPNAIERLLNYQDKCAKVLHEHFMGTKEKKEEFFEEMGLKGEIVELKGNINNLENKIETMDKTMGTLINSATINSYQAKQLNKLARERISHILGGAHSPLYKKESRMYFKNLWLNLCDRFEVSEYRDLNPLNYNDAVTYINNWSMM